MKYAPNARRSKPGISQRMIDIGADLIREIGCDDPEDLAVAVYSAMWSISPRRANDRRDLKISRLKDILFYCPADGTWVWLVAINRNIECGSLAGTPDKKGYIRIGVDGHQYAAHVLAWFYMTGEWPEKTIDHTDLDKSNNKWHNLREATLSQNRANIRRHSTNTSGYKGVGKIRGSKRFQANIKVNGTRHYLGAFDTAEEAHVAYSAAADRFFGEFARAS